MFLIEKESSEVRIQPQTGYFVLKESSLKLFEESYCGGESLTINEQNAKSMKSHCEFATRQWEIIANEWPALASNANWLAEVKVLLLA